MYELINYCRKQIEISENMNDTNNYFWEAINNVYGMSSDVPPLVKPNNGFPHIREALSTRKIAQNDINFSEPR